MNVLDDVRQHHLVRWPPEVFVGQFATPIPLHESGCKFVVDQGHTLAVPDTLDHPVLCSTAWAQFMRSYLGTPVEYGGQPIGSLCVLTAQPREWHRADELALEAVARLVSHALF